MIKELLMSITVLPYHNQAFVDQINTAAIERARALEEEKAARAAAANFSTALSNASAAYGSTASAPLSECPPDLYAIFKEAGDAFGVSVNLLTSIARAESGFDPNAVSSAGAVGMMQLMPATAAALGVINSYDVRENIMGGAKYISQLLDKYNGNTSLALAAYNAGSSNVDSYGGIPPFTETQNYVQKVLSYFHTENKSDLKESLSNLLSAGTLHADTLRSFARQFASSEAAADTPSAPPADSETEKPSITVTVL